MFKKIILQKCNFKNIFFLLHIVAFSINIIIVNNIFVKGINDKNGLYNLGNQILTNIYTETLSAFIAIIPYFIRKILVKSKRKNNNSNIDFRIYKNNEKSLAKKKQIILYFFLVGILDFIKRFSTVLYNIIYNKSIFLYSFNCITPFEIAFQFICSYFILKVHFYKLQYFSLFLNLGAFIILLIIDLINALHRKMFDGKVYYFLLINIISYSIEFSLGKKLLLYEFISIYSLFIIKGFIELFCAFLFSLIMFFTKKDIFSKMMIFLNDKKCLWLLIAKIFSTFFIDLFNWLIIDRFSPNYYPFALISDEISCFIFLQINDYYPIYITWDFYIRIFFYLISFISVIIHNEIIVINICNLGSDTKYFLDLEFEREELFAKTDNPEIIKKYETLIEMGSEDGSSIENEEEDLFEK